jgi:hypothetical protein
MPDHAGLPGGERIMGATLRPIADLRPGDAISTGTVTRAVQSAPQAQVYRLCLSDGRRVRLTAHQRVKVVREAGRTSGGRSRMRDEWVEAGSLRPGDQVPFPLAEECGGFHPDCGTKPGFYTLAGLFFADGTFQFHTLHQARPWDAPIVPRDLRIDKLLREEIGLDKLGPEATWHLPPSVLNASAEKVCAFLGGWFRIDGSVHFQTAKGRKLRFRVSVDRMSAAALRDTQMVLAKLGIHSWVFDNSGLPAATRGQVGPRSSLLHVLKRTNVKRFFEKIRHVCFVDQFGNMPAKYPAAAWPAIDCGILRGTNRNYGRLLSCVPDGRETVYGISVDSNREFVAELVPLATAT